MVDRSTSSLRLRWIAYSLLGVGLCLVFLVGIASTWFAVQHQLRFQARVDTTRSRLTSFWNRFRHHPEQFRTKGSLQAVGAVSLLHLVLFPDGRLRQPVATVLPAPPNGLVLHPLGLLTGTDALARSLWERGRMLEARGDLQRAVRAFRRIPVGTRHANGLPFDVLVPFRLYQLQQPVVDVLFAQLSRPDVSVAYRRLMLEKLQVSPYLQERATKMLAHIQSEVRAIRVLQRAPTDKWRRQCFRGRDGLLFWQKGRRGLWWVSGKHLQGVVSSLWRSWSPTERATVRFSLVGFGEGCASKSSGHVAAGWWTHSARQIGVGPVVLSFRRVDWWGPWTLVFVWVGLLCVLVFMLLGGESLRRLWKKEQQLHHQQTLFSAAVAHELRTPLTSLALTTEMLVSEGLPAEKLPRYHRRLAEQVERLQGVVANVIAYHRGSFAEVAGEPVSLVDVVKEAMVATDAKAQRVGCALSLVVQGEPSACTVRVGRTGLLRVVINIVDNACKYAPGTSVVLTVGPGARLSVRDGGPGIPDDVLPLVFAPFVQGKRPEGGGLGLGLALVKEVVSHSGGSCQMRNHPEGGAECTLVWET